MKKVLVVHNKYQNIGGEDISVDEEIKLLSKFYTVETIYFENSVDGFLNLFSNLLFSNNKKSNRIFKNKVEEFKPDVIYIHNTWFKASLGIFKISKKKNIKTILKIHNFRYHCTKSHLSKKHVDKNNFCEACGFDRKKYKIYNKYFDDSYLKSFFVNLYGKRYIKLINDDSLHIILLTNFHKNFMKKNNYKNKQLYVIPNYILPLSNSEHSDMNYIVYAGRVSEEKGLEELIDSFLNSNSEMLLKIIGDGPLLKSLKENFKNKNIEFLGGISNDETIKIINNSQAVVTATKLYEGQPTLLSEASALGVASIFPETGGIAEFFPENYELSFEQHNYKELKNIFNTLSQTKDLKTIGKENKRFYFENFNEDNYIKKMEKIINDE